MAAPTSLRALGGFAVAFGIATMLSGGRVLFGWTGAREAAGQVVPFVLWFNTVAGAFYVAAGVAMAGGKAWAVPLARLLAAGTLIAFAAFGLHVWRGGAYEARTVAALLFRSGFWVGAALLLPGMFGRARAARG